MPTVTARFEPSKKNPDYGTIYYRIYKGHNRRMEFSSRIRLSKDMWDKQSSTIIDVNDEMKNIHKQIDDDLNLLNQIICEADDSLTMGDIIAIFKQKKMSTEQN